MTGSDDGLKPVPTGKPRISWVPAGALIQQRHSRNKASTDPPPNDGMFGSSAPAPPLAWTCALGLSLLAGCGGGGGDTPASNPPLAPAPSPAGPTLAQRTQAASLKATSATNACSTATPFYWEIGDRNSLLASGAVDRAGSPQWRADTVISIACASKWLWGAYAVERRSGVLTAADVKALNLTSGHTSFRGCARTQTVDECLAQPGANGSTNGSYTAADDGFFAYGGGHMQQHASALGLGIMGNVALAAEQRRLLGTDIALSYSQPQPAGAVQTTPADYARFLRKMLNGQLRMGAALGSQAVCTNPLTCATARSTPIAPNESWHYALGHWVENDTTAGDGAFSSPGAFGFYPWVDASRQWYGVLARESTTGSPAMDSARCGRLIRQAWVSGNAL